MNKAALTRPRRKQARPLTTAEVQFLEGYLKDPTKDIRDRYAVGCFLFVLFNRSRWSDLRLIDSYILDIDENDRNFSGFIEFRTTSHKTAAQVAKHGFPMPLVAPIWGLTSPPWGIAFKTVADRAGCELTPDYAGPLLPAPKADGSWSLRSTSSDEATKWLLEVLKPRSEDLTEVSSHSLKASPLSWMAKAGLEPSHRQVLGHHSTGKGSLETYSRDQLSAPLRAFEGVLRQIRIGALCPDKTRSGHVRAPTQPDCRDEHSVAKATVSTSDSDSSSTSSSSSGSTSLDDDDLAQLPAAPLPQRTWGVDNMFQHKHSRVIHLESQMGSGIFFCGVHASSEHVLISSAAFLEIRQCKKCVKAITAAGYADLSEAKMFFCLDFCLTAHNGPQVQCFSTASRLCPSPQTLQIYDFRT